jgi:dienelactone hydrolase
MTLSLKKIFTAITVMQILNIASRFVSVFLSAVMLSACVTLPVKMPLISGFKKSFIKTEDFTLTSCTRITKLGEPVRIYIEGDGCAWISRRRLSNDPSPSYPLVIELVSRDSALNVAYIARPGQYTENGAFDLDPSYWSNKRFSQEVIQSLDEAIDVIAKKAQSKSIELVGYSGGAAIAVLVAARRDDVVSLRTIAGNLDPDKVSRYHSVDRLNGSLNPIDFVSAVKNIPQRHFLGSQDAIIPAFVTKSFVAKAGDKNYESITIVRGTTHTKGWHQNWDKLVTLPLISY